MAPVYLGHMDKLPVDSATSQRLTLGTDELTVLASSDDNGGALCAIEIRMPPGGGPPVMHRHAPSEVYYVLEGEFTFYVGDPDARVDRVTAAVGQVVPLAGGTPHTIRNESYAEAVAFVVHAPGAQMEQFSRAAAAMAADGGPPDMQAVLAVAAEHGIELLGPVPTPE
jgi:mannose-6-phosphate isomerase-like protein (cupin superfamily)